MWTHPKSAAIACATSLLVNGVALDCSVAHAAGVIKTEADRELCLEVGGTPTEKSDEALGNYIECRTPEEDDACRKEFGVMYEYDAMQAKCMWPAFQ